MSRWPAALAVAEAAAATRSIGPGCAFVLFDKDGFRISACGGQASLRHSIAFTLDAPSSYASISKLFLAATLLLEGLDLTVPAVWMGTTPAGPTSANFAVQTLVNVTASN